MRYLLIVSATSIGVPGYGNRPHARGERLQIMLTEEELNALDDWRFKMRMPSRASAVRELLKRGLATEGFAPAGAGMKSEDFGVTDGSARDKRAPKPNGEA